MYTLLKAELHNVHRSAGSALKFTQPSPARCIDLRVAVDYSLGNSKEDDFCKYNDINAQLLNICILAMP